MNPTHSWGSYSMMYRNDSENINLTLKNYSYTPCFAAWSKRNVCKLVLGVILSYFEMVSGCLSDSNTTRYTVSSIVSVCISNAILWTKTGNPLVINAKSPARLITCDKISLRVTKEDLYHNMMKFLQECSSHIAKCLPHTHLLLASSHVIWHTSAAYRMVVISKYD